MDSLHIWVFKGTTNSKTVFGLWAPCILLIKRQIRPPIFKHQYILIKTIFHNPVIAWFVFLPQTIDPQDRTSAAGTRQVTSNYCVDSLWLWSLGHGLCFLEIFKAETAAEVISHLFGFASHVTFSQYWNVSLLAYHLTLCFDYE